MRRFFYGVDARSRRRHGWRTGCGRWHAVVGLWLQSTPTPGGSAGTDRCPGAAYRSRSGKDATGFHGIIYTVADLQPLQSG